MYIKNFNNYFIESIKIFLLAFIIGKSIDNIFTRLQNKHSNINPIIFGIFQLIVVIIAAYYLHIFTSNQFSNEMQIYAPNVLFSSFIFTLQTNIMKNFESITIHELFNLTL